VSLLNGKESAAPVAAVQWTTRNPDNQSQCVPTPLMYLINCKPRVDTACSTWHDHDQCNRAFSKTAGPACDLPVLPNGFRRVAAHLPIVSRSFELASIQTDDVVLA